MFLPFKWTNGKSRKLLQNHSVVFSYWNLTFEIKVNKSRISVKLFDQKYFQGCLIEHRKYQRVRLLSLRGQCMWQKALHMTDSLDSKEFWNFLENLKMKSFEKVWVLIPHGLNCCSGLSGINNFSSIWIFTSKSWYPWKNHFLRKGAFGSATTTPFIRTPGFS